MEISTALTIGQASSALWHSGQGRLFLVKKRLLDLADRFNSMIFSDVHATVNLKGGLPDE
jgi:hypothetical protein